MRKAASGDLTSTARFAPKTLITRKTAKRSEAITQIRDQFGSEPVFNHFSVSRLNVSFTVRDRRIQMKPTAIAAISMGSGSG
jgi:hypothetical protein